MTQLRSYARSYVDFDFNILGMTHLLVSGSVRSWGFMPPGARGQGFFGLKGSILVPNWPFKKVKSLVKGPSGGRKKSQAFAQSLCPFPWSKSWICHWLLVNIFLYVTIFDHIINSKPGNSLLSSMFGALIKCLALSIWLYCCQFNYVYGPLFNWPLFTSRCMSHWFPNPQVPQKAANFLTMQINGGPGFNDAANLRQALVLVVVQR